MIKVQKKWWGFSLLYHRYDWIFWSPKHIRDHDLKFAFFLIVPLAWLCSWFYFYDDKKILPLKGRPRCILEFKSPFSQNWMILPWWTFCGINPYSSRLNLIQLKEYSMTHLENYVYTWCIIGKKMNIQHFPTFLLQSSK